MTQIHQSGPDPKHEPPRNGSAGWGLDSRGLPSGYPLRADWEVTPREVKAMLDRHDDFLLIDCRTSDEHGIAKIAGAQLLPLQELVARLGELESFKSRKIVIHCHHGMRSLQMASMLRQRGFEDVRSMAGGIDVWAMDIERGMARY